MSRLISRALAAALVLAVPAVQGCDSCGGSKKKAALAKKKAKSKKNRKKGKKKGKARKKNLDAGLAPQSGVAAVVHLGDRALLWTEGRTSALGRKVEGLSWSEVGFSWSAKDGHEVLAPGGALYWRATAPKDGRPVADLLAKPDVAPEGYELTASAGRGGNYKLGLTAPGGRSYRLGMSRDTPKTTAWLKGVLPSGVKATSPLAKDTAWPKDAEGRLTNALPEGLTAVTAAPAAAEKTASWTADLKKLAGAEATVAGSMVLDLDRDGTDETVVCMDRTTGDYGCFVVDEVGGINQFHGVQMPWRGGDSAPLAASKGEAPYVLFAGAPANAKEGAPPIGHALYFDGGAYQVSLHR